MSVENCNMGLGADQSLEGKRKIFGRQKYVIHCTGI